MIQFLKASENDWKLLEVQFSVGYIDKLIDVFKYQSKPIII